jgi:hypothetical protein
LAISPLITCIEPSGARRFNILFLLQCKNELKETDILKFIQVHFPDYKTSKRNVNSYQVIDILDSRHVPVFSFSFLNGIICLSKNAVLVEDAISAFTNNKFRNNKLTDLMINHLADERIYINYHKLSKLFNVYANVSTHLAINSMDSLADAGVYDIQWINTNENINSSQEVVSLQGEIVSSEKNKYLSIFLNQQPQKINLPEVISSGSSLFAEWGANSVKDYFIAYREYLNAKGTSDNLISYVSKINEKFNINLEKDVLPLFGKEWGYAVKEPLSKEQDILESFYIQVTDTIDFAGILDSLFPQKINMTSNKASDYRNYRIRKWPIEEFLPLIFGKHLFKRFNAPYFTQVGNYLVFTQTETELKRVIDSYVDNQTLSSDPNWKFFKTNLASTSNFLLYIDPSRSMILGNKFVRDDFINEFNLNLQYYKSIGASGFQVSGNSKNFFSLITFQKLKGRQGGVEMLWSQTMEADAATVPIILAESGQNIILVQDKNLNLYKYSSSGSLQWKVKLESQIIGNIFPVKLFEGGAVQYLFATRSRIHLINTNGSEVGAYPIRLSSPASTGLSIFQFNNENQIRYFIGTENAKLYGFNLNGQPLAGWSPQSLSEKTDLPVKYFTNAGENYLFTVTSKGQLYVWDSKGKLAFQPISIKTQFENPFKIKFGSSLDNNILYSVDTAGILYEIKLDGNIQRVRFSSTITHPFFDYYDSDGNGKPEYILSGKTNIVSLNRDNTLNWKINVSSPLYYPPQFVTSGNENWIGYAAAAENMIYLRSRAGTLFQGFPIRGNRDFAVADINNDGVTSLVTVGNDKKIYLYRIGK